jgi:hypothetical protein
MREERIFKHGSILLLAGGSLVCLAFLSPNAPGASPDSSFFKVAISAHWGKFMDLTAAWCSLKIIIFCLGMFLVIESIGTILSLLRRTKTAMMIYCLHLIPCLGILIGSYCLIKALL